MDLSTKAAKGSEAHNHVLFMYDSHQERMWVLAEYFSDGIAKNELCVFVTPDPPEAAIADFEREGFAAGAAVQRNNLRIFEMAKTYLPNGQFMADFMLANVKDFIRDARAGGYSGLRTAGEMMWMADHPEAAADGRVYEESVTAITDANPNFTGMCLYPLRESPSRILDAALQTHPSFIYDGTVQANPFYDTQISH